MSKSSSKATGRPTNRAETEAGPMGDQVPSIGEDRGESMADKPARWCAYALAYYCYELRCSQIAYEHGDVPQRMRRTHISAILDRLQRLSERLSSHLDSTASERIHRTLTDTRNAEENLANNRSQETVQDSTASNVKRTEFPEVAWLQKACFIGWMTLNWAIRGAIQESTVLRQWLLVGRAIGHFQWRLTEAPSNLPRLQPIVDSIEQLGEEELRAFPLLTRLVHLARNSSPDDALEIFSIILNADHSQTDLPLIVQMHFLIQRIAEFSDAIQEALLEPRSLVARLNVELGLDPPQAVLDGKAYALKNREVGIFLEEVRAANGNWVAPTKIREKYPEFLTDRTDRLTLPPQIEELIERKPGRGSRMRPDKLA
jgi:hypothetical protein